jgi:plasmid stabilization system protein ParE
MTGYDFHPEAEIDLAEIWEYIADEDASAADRMIADLRAYSRQSCAVPASGTSPPRPYWPPAAFQAGAGLPDRLCAG